MKQRTAEHFVSHSVALQHWNHQQAIFESDVIFFSFFHDNKWIFKMWPKSKLVTIFLVFHFIKLSSCENITKVDGDFSNGITSSNFQRRHPLKSSNFTILLQKIKDSKDKKSIEKQGSLVRTRPKLTKVRKLNIIVNNIDNHG